MWSAATVLTCALDLLSGRFPSPAPIELLDSRPRSISMTAEAFVHADTIYLITSTPVFRLARAAREECGEKQAILKLASIIVHERWHLEHGFDERPAYEAQLTALSSLGAGVGTPVYHGVMKSMEAVLRAARTPAAPRPGAASPVRDGSWASAIVGAPRESIRIERFEEAGH